LSDVEHDLCLLYAPAAANYKAATVASDSPQTGQTVFAIGFAGGGSVRVSSGQIDAIYDYDGGKVIQTSAWFASGASGGGLFDEQGRLIGIISFMSRGPVVRHYCLPASWAARAAEHFDGGQPVTPLNGLPFWQEPEDRRPQFLQTANLKPTGG
jgi:S1-C subfamily serine protease